jgi:phage-related protein
VKPIDFLGDALDRLRLFPKEVRRAAGFQLYRVQRGLQPLDWKPSTSVGAGACEKKTQATSKRDIELATRRYRELKEEQK